MRQIRREPACVPTKGTPVRRRQARQSRASPRWPARRLLRPIPRDPARSGRRRPPAAERADPTTGAPGWHPASHCQNTAAFARLHAPRAGIEPRRLQPPAASVRVGRLPPARPSADGILCAMKKNFPARDIGAGQTVPHVSRVEAMRLLLVVGTGLLALTACVGTEKSGFEPASARLSQLQPKSSSTDDVVLPGQATRQARIRTNTGVDPLSILHARQGRTSVADIQNDKQSSGPASSSPSGMAVSGVPVALPAERAVRPANLAPTLMSSGLPGVRQAPPRRSEDTSSLTEVETRAEKEAAAQQMRDRRFDAQVRRVTASICSGCTRSQANPNIGN